MNNKNNILISLVFVLASCSIGSIKPHNNKDFAEINDLKEYEGTYKNRGEPKGYLSKVLWGENHNPFKLGSSSLKYPDRNIKYIQVKVKNRKFTISAVGKECEYFSKEYKKDIDFKITNGQIELISKIGNTLDGRNVVVGIKSSTVVLGLDTEGNGKFKRSRSEVGMAYMILPVAVGSTEELRFKKSTQIIKYPKCK